MLGCFGVSIIHQTLTWYSRSLTCEIGLFACVYIRAGRGGGGGGGFCYEKTKRMIKSLRHNVEFAYAKQLEIYATPLPLMWNKVVLFEIHTLQITSRS